MSCIQRNLGIVHAKMGITWTQPLLLAIRVIPTVLLVSVPLTQTVSHALLAQSTSTRRLLA